MAIVLTTPDVKEIKIATSTSVPKMALVGGEFNAGGMDTLWALLNDAGGVAGHEKLTYRGDVSAILQKIEGDVARLHQDDGQMAPGESDVIE